MPPIQIISTFQWKWSLLEFGFIAIIINLSLIGTTIREYKSWKRDVDAENDDNRRENSTAPKKVKY